MAEHSTEGRRTCGSCLQWVGTAYDGEQREYRTWTDASGVHTFCADSAACERRLAGEADALRMGAAEARIYDPEPDDEDDDGW